MKLFILVETAKETLMSLAEGRHYERFTINKIGMPRYFYLEQGRRQIYQIERDNQVQSIAFIARMW